MIRNTFYRIFFVFLFLICSSTGFAVQERLSEDDIHRVMNQILERHVNKHELSQEVLKKSFQTYIDQFDYRRIYLLENEKNEYVELPSNLLLEQYQKGDYSKYEELNEAIQHSILRARAMRSELLKDSKSLFQKSDQLPKSVDNGEKLPSFPQTLPELKQRIETDIVKFIRSERDRYGDEGVFKNKDKTLQAYERFLKLNENQYLYQNDKGKGLSEEEKENLFVMHVLKALTRSLDSHTSFLNNDEAYDMKIRLEKGFQGIGVILQRKPEGVVIARLIDDSPAQRSGLVKIGDRIVQINGEIVSDYSLEELVSRLRDLDHKNVNLVLKRTNHHSVETTHKVTLTRELIAVDEGRVEVKEEVFEDGIIGKITLFSFYQGKNGVTSEKDIRQAIKELENKGNLKGIILDLRENGGGFLNQAVKVAGLFITNGVVVVSKYSNGQERFYRDMDGKVSFDGPLIVLTSKATASAAEIVAQALQDYGVAVVVGDEQTYGKGTIQSQTVTDGDASSHFKVTVGKYYTVSGKTPQVRGVKADIVVPSHYNHEVIGEEYLQNTLRSDTIHSTYKDELADIDPGLKPWYLRYYMPTLQKQESDWAQFIPILKKRSDKRISNNPKFQEFMDGKGMKKFGKEFAEVGNPTVDYQMEEAVNILKDMILLEKEYHHSDPYFLRESGF